MATSSSVATRFNLVFFVPPSALAACKAAIFAAGAGRYPGPGNYTECCWTAMGTGQFRPGETANPHIGRVGILEEVQEVRVETLCVSHDTARKVVQALKKYISIHVDAFTSFLVPCGLVFLGRPDLLPSAHPYEEPVYQVYRLEDF